MKTKILALVLVCALALVGACGKNPAAPSGATTASFDLLAFGGTPSTDTHVLIWYTGHLTQPVTSFGCIVTQTHLECPPLKVRITDILIGSTITLTVSGADATSPVTGRIIAAGDVVLANQTGTGTVTVTAVAK